MNETPTSFHHLEWPAPGAVVAGPIVWLRGWVVGKPNFDFTDIRVVCSTGTHLGVLGLPRTDLAAHFKSSRPWLPAEFVIGVPLAEGQVTLWIEAMDDSGNWHALQSLALTVSSAGIGSPRVEGEVIIGSGGSTTTRVPHLPFHGHLDQPASQPTIHDGRVEIFGWLLHETQEVRAVFATFDGFVFNVLESGLTDESLATKVPAHAAARQARVRGEVDAPPTLTSPACLRVYATLADGSVHLCFARRIELKHSLNPEKTDVGASLLATQGVTGREQARSHKTEAVLAPLPSGRPRRLLLVARTLYPDDTTLRALDVARHLASSGRWATRLVASEDGPLREAFEASGCPVQLVDPRAFFAAKNPTETAAALKNLGREIWWRHLDAVAIFDPASTWAGQLAREQRLPVFADPVHTVLWPAPSPAFTFDANGAVLAPIRGLARQGAGVLLHAARHLTRHPGNYRLIATDIRETPEEKNFRASLKLQVNPILSLAPMTTSAAAVICPAFANHPHRELCSAIAAGIPVITTPSPLLAAIFCANELIFVPPGNPLALANAIADTLANSVARERRVAAAARIVAARHAPALQLAQWEKLLEATVAG